MGTEQPDERRSRHEVDRSLATISTDRQMQEDDLSEAGSGGGVPDAEGRRPSGDSIEDWRRKLAKWAVRHGRAATYSHHACRCQPCQTAWNEHQTSASGIDS